MLYTLAIYLYQLVVILISPFYKKARILYLGQREAFRILKREVDKEARYVWFHAASLGEFEQGRPLMEHFRREHPEYKILLTFFSPSGYEVRKNYEGADIICYLPFDTPSNVYRFMHLIRPEMAFFIKYEFWYDYMWACHHYHIPVYSVSSIFRPNKIFFRWYGRVYAHVLSYVAHFFVQDEQSRELLARRGIVDNVSIVGDTRFDRVIDIARQAKELPLVERFCKDVPFVFVAGSSWPPDEDLIISYFNSHPDMKLVLAPHVIDDGHLRQIEQKLRRPSLRYTEATEENVEKAQCLIINCYGLLSSIYRYAHVAYVGGGFGVGIHNVLEAAVWGMPVIFGPNNKNFQEAQGLLAAQGGFEISDEEDFQVVMDRLMTDEKLLQSSSEKAGTFVNGQAGATHIVMSALGL